MNFIEELQARNLIQDLSDPKVSSLEPGTSFYHGFDPTAPSLHIGNLVGIIVAIHLAKAGLKPILLTGGATGSIGDPSGKDKERQLLERETIEVNVSRQRRKVTEILERMEITPSFVNNYNWTKDLTVLEFLRDVGKHFTVNYMMQKDSVKQRFNAAGISFTEFSYMLLQSYDFYYLYQNNNCKLQIGGSDQWGNITSGLELIRRKCQGEAYAFCWPLILDSQGKKFGKSEGGAVWLNEELFSPYKFHQFWLNVEDEMVIQYLKTFSFLELSRIAEIEAEMKSAPEKRIAQKTLADEVCTLVHGAEATRDAKRSAEVLFGGSLEGLSASQLEEIFRDVPSSTLALSIIDEQKSYLELLVESGLSKSKGEARRLIQSGGAYLNNQRVSEVDYKPAKADLIEEKLLVLRSGKKKYHLLKLS